ncbi:hypothetical protein HS088_TW02G00421 [Tripterygium wilfordii]|uniref:Uncharacterized protein n=1 Tax=Tripterygium wilfordii TaxID=458696 RepID=A0A7J7DYK9_TRIWF|nr:uncharacterized protein LOC120006290 [Tripterygium wilfordii]KAF5751407.1 hypothetical protein HS088_TW02G00421 [Tripterygium wilfordii]
MEDSLKPRKDSRDQQSSGYSENKFIAQSGQCLNLQDKSKPEKPNVSYSDLHCEIMKNVEVSPKSLKNRQKQKIKDTKEDELVKYMSSLPSYLEKGKDLQEKVLNVGVLDWASLEKWQYSHRQIPCRTSRDPISSSCSSSSFSTESFSFHSSRGHTRSPTRQKVRHPSLQVHLITSSPKESPYKVDKPYGGGVAKFQDVSHAQSNSTNQYGNLIRRDQLSRRNHVEIKAEHYCKKSSDIKFYRDIAHLPNKLNKDLAPCSHVSAKTKEGEFKGRVEKLQGQKPNIVEQDISQKNKPVVLLLPRDYSQHNDSKPSNPAAMLVERQGVGSRRSFVETSKQAYCAKLNSDIPHSCPLSLEVDSGEHFQMERCFNDAQSTDTLRDISYSAQSAPEMGNCSSRCRKLEKIMPAMRSSNSIANASKAVDHKVSGVVAGKSRSTSPFRRLGFGIGNIGKSFSSKEDLAKPEFSLKHISACSGRDNSVGISCQGTSNSDKPYTTGRRRSSPLRRLLDPLLKPKATNYQNFREPLQRDSIESIPTNGAGRSYDGKSDSSAGTLMSTLLQDKKHRSTIQALLQVVFKNGQPLFTFAVDKNNDILAATMKKFSASRKSDYNCIYTIFTIKDVMKRNGRWMDHSGKSKSDDYVPNVLAQLKATGFQVTNFTRQNHMALESGIREFVLFAVALRETDQQTSEFQPHDELAAIVVKIPKDISRSSVVDNHQNDICNKVPEFSDSVLDVKKRPITGGQGLIKTSVILPSGVHSLPTNGGPSSLIQRWTSNGSCDCGGWDLGCKLRVFSNWNQFIKKSSSSKAHCDTHKFELYPQGGEQGNDPALALAPFKDGIYSVEFNSSLSLLQAFAVCIAVLDTRRPCELSESCALVEEKTSVENIIAQNDGIRASNLFGGEVPARYASYPPHSPVGRA